MQRNHLITAIAMMIVAVAMVVALRAEGRVWFCSCGEPRLWVGDTNSLHNSQHLLDPYSLTHVLHGVLFCGLLSFVGRRIPAPWAFVAVAVFEAVWEVLENSPIVIDRYRAATIAVGYTGDSIVNSLGDLACCLTGYLLAKRLGWIKSAVFFAVVEIVLLITIRDNLTLNILMLLYPLDAIKQWQGR